MSKLEKLPIFFVSINTLVNMYKQNENIKFENLGVITDQRIPVCQVYYQIKELTITPYTLSVDLDKIIRWRENIVQYIIDDMISRYQKGQSLRTITTYTKKVFYFVDWIDKNKLKLNDNIKTAQHAFHQYTVFLKSKVRDGSYSQGEAHSRHMCAYKLLHSIYHDKENIIAAGIRIIPNRRTNKVEKNQLKDQKYHYNFYHSFFNQVTDFLLKNKPYPLKLKLPMEEIWCLPSTTTFFSKDKIFPMAFEPTDGTIKGVEEIQRTYNLRTTSIARGHQQEFIKRLKKHNQFYSNKRLQLARHSLKAFFILFLTNTGMNDSTASTLKWDSVYTTEQEKFKFKTIKYRAGNKTIEFQIQSNFIKDFKKFILLREYILQEKKSDYLFFSGNETELTVNKSQIQGRFSSEINNYFINNIDSNLPILNSKQLRVNKTHQVIKTDGIIAASQLAQSSVNTIINSYLGESQESCDEQFNEYFNNLNKSILENSNNAIETAIGQCKKANTPEQNFTPIVFQNNCDYKEGCLFCKHFGLHTDEKDLKKLYSLKYVINECKYIAKNESHFISIYSDVLSRINSIEEEIVSTNKLSKISLQEYEKDVFENENLHPYWENKLNTLLKMGVLR